RAPAVERGALRCARRRLPQGRPRAGRARPRRRPRRPRRVPRLGGEPQVDGVKWIVAPLALGAAALAGLLVAVWPTGGRSGTQIAASLSPRSPQFGDLVTAHIDAPAGGPARGPVTPVSPTAYHRRR